MSILYNMNEIREQVQTAFGDTENYLVVIKHNNWQSDIIKLLLGGVLYPMDSSRQFVLYFSPKGIYEKELGNPFIKEFVLLPWHEITDISIKPWYLHKVIRCLHLGKQLGYEVLFSGRINQDNKRNLEQLIANDWHRIC